MIQKKLTALCFITGLLQLNLQAQNKETLQQDIVSTSTVNEKKSILKSERTAVLNNIANSKAHTQTTFFLDTFRLSSIPAQISFTPGLSTQGKQGKYISNNFSLNILGGRTGGVSGVEIGGLFNINKGDVRSVQVAGLFNETEGRVQGLQVGGIHNNVTKGVMGVQVGGIDNIVKGNVDGLQVAGIYNHITGETKGMQLAGIVNYARKSIKGMQVSGIGNISSNEMKGVQVAGIFNYARKLKGVQIGLINVADSSDGYSIGLLNFVPNGYHKLVISSNEVFQVNVAYKSGNRKLYTILLGGASAKNYAKAYSFGVGLGTEIPLINLLSINSEISSQYVYLGTFKDYNSLNRASVDLHLKLGKHFSIFGGPAISGYYAETKNPFPGYKTELPKESSNAFKINRNMIGWIGWNAGISMF